MSYMYSHYRNFLRGLSQKVCLSDVLCLACAKQFASKTVKYNMLETIEMHFNHKVL
jgi:hypothetical protein